MEVWFELSKSSNGQFNFVLKSADHVLLRSEQYQSKQSAQNAIASIQANSPHDARYDKKVSSNGKPYFNLKAANHEIIGTSPMFESEQARDDSVALVKANGASTTVKDKT
jgi:uncharacterized protein YegP (UPF0339 family)